MANQLSRDSKTYDRAINDCVNFFLALVKSFKILRCFVEKVCNVAILQILWPFWQIVALYVTFWHCLAFSGSFGPFTLFC